MYRLEDTHYWFAAKRAYVRAVLPPPTGQWNILDIGSGTGGMSVFLSEWGQVTGVENSPYAYNYLDKRGVRYKKGSIDSIRLKPRSYDLVCLFDVLYHRGIHNDRLVLRKAYNSLRVGGLLCIHDCVDIADRARHKLNWHMGRLYSDRELVTKVSDAGFSIQKASYTFFLVYPIFLFVQTISSFVYFDSISQLPRILNSMLYRICSLEAFLLRWFSFPIGSSAIILAKRGKLIDRGHHS